MIAVKFTSLERTAQILLSATVLFAVEIQFF